MEYYGVGGSSHYAFRKIIDKIKLSSKSINDIEIDFGIIDSSGEINGLIGLDILIEVGAVIDLNKLEIHVN